jgi:hypothetical protein
VPALRGVDLWITRDQLPPFVKLLELLPPESCQAAQNRKFHILSSADTTIYLTIPEERHPGKISPLGGEAAGGGSYRGCRAAPEQHG